MYSMSNLVFAFIMGGGIGAVVGWYLALNARGDNKRKVIMDLESQLDQAKQDRADYCLLYTSPSPRDGLLSRMPSSA